MGFYPALTTCFDVITKRWEVLGCCVGFLGWKSALLAWVAECSSMALTPITFADLTDWSFVTYWPYWSFRKLCPHFIRKYLAVVKHNVFFRRRRKRSKSGETQKSGTQRVALGSIQLRFLVVTTFCVRWWWLSDPNACKVFLWIWTRNITQPLSLIQHLPAFLSSESGQILLHPGNEPKWTSCDFSLTPLRRFNSFLSLFIILFPQDV